MTTYARTVAGALLTTLIAVLLAAPAPAATPARGASAVPGAPAGARLLACHRSPSLDQRSVVVGTWMRPLPSGRRLAVKLDLWQRMPNGRWALRSDVPGLGTWTTPSDPQLGSQPGDVFKYRQAVGHLVVPAAYRFHVSFRWLGADGTIVREASLTTRACRQPDLRPDLALLSVRVVGAPRADGRVRYAVLVGNEGRSASPRATVAATLPGDGVPGQHVRTLRALTPGATARVVFVGPGCAAGGEAAAFAADPSNAVDEADEANNELSASCPAP